MQRIILVLILAVASSFTLCAQSKVANDKEAVTFEELYDEPYSINKLFIGFQPFYGELFATNINAGFGLEAHYFHKVNFDIKASLRKTYSSKFFDFNRELSLRNSVVANVPEIYSYYELGGTYHVKDFDESGTTKIFLHKKSFTANQWASMVPQFAEVPCKVRKIYGARVGAIIWNSTIDVSRALDKQGLTNADLVDPEGLALPDTYLNANGDPTELNTYSNLYSTNFYLGGSYSWIRNVAVSFDKYEEGMDDGMLTLFLDLIVAPSLTIDPVLYNNLEYSTGAIKTKKIGVRAGIEGKFNRTLGWSYGGEMGYRPSTSGRGFFALIKISFPVFSTNLENKVKAFSK